MIANDSGTSYDTACSTPAASDLVHSQDYSHADSPRVYWGPIQSPEKAFISQLDDDTLKTPARPPAALSIQIPPSPNQSGSLNGAETLNARSRSSGPSFGYSREGTPDHDTLPFDEPTSALAERVLRAQDNPSPPPTPRNFGGHPSSQPSSPYATMDELFPPIPVSANVEASASRPQWFTPPDMTSPHHLPPGRPEEGLPSIDVQIMSIKGVNASTPSHNEEPNPDEFGIQTSTGHNNATIAENDALYLNVASMSLGLFGAPDAGLHLSGENHRPQRDTEAATTVTPVYNTEPSHPYIPHDSEDNTVTPTRLHVPERSTPRRRSPRLSDGHDNTTGPSGLARLGTDGDPSPYPRSNGGTSNATCNTIGSETLNYVSDLEAESDMTPRDSPVRNPQPVFSNLKGKGKALPVDLSGNNTARVTGVGSITSPILPLKIRKHTPSNSSSRASSETPCTSTEDERGVVAHLSPHQSAESVGPREPSPSGLLTPLHIPSRKKSPFPLSAPARERREHLFTSRALMGTAARDDPVRSPQRVPVPSPKAAKFVPRSPVKALTTDPIWTPKRVPVSQSRSAPLPSQAKSRRSPSPRSTSPQELSFKNQTTGPKKKEVSVSGSKGTGILPPAPQPSRPPTTLPFPFPSSPIPPEALQTNSSHRGGSDPPVTEAKSVGGPAKPQKSLLRQPSHYTSKIPRIETKPYARPLGKESKLPVLTRLSSALAPAGRAKKAPPVETSAPPYQSPSVDSGASRVPLDIPSTPPSLKRKRDAVVSPSQTSPRRMEAIVLIERRSPSSMPRSGGIANRTSPVQTGKNAHFPQVVDPIPGSHDEHDSDTEGSSKMRRTARPRKPDASGGGGLGNRLAGGGTRAQSNGRQRILPRARGHHPGDPFMMSALALRTLTSMNTTKNQEYAVAQIQTRVERREGARPESPATKIKTIIQKQKEGQSRDREERAARRARRSDGELGEDENEDPSEPASPTLHIRHRLGAGEEEEYVTPQRPSHSLRHAESKRVKWDHALFTTVYLDEIQIGQDPLRDRNAGKSCLAMPAKDVRLDPLGNVPNAGVGLPDLVKESVEVVKVVYEDDDDPISPIEVEVDDIPALKPKPRTRKRSKA